MEWSQLPYQYETLSPREIRVVVLHPLTSEDGIHCELKRVFIDENPIYEALSYVWGDASHRVPIRVGSGTLEVTQNLYSALRALVHQDTERTIWIDALCINQNDISEKNHQVQFMKEVYTRASSVVIWLGPEADGSDDVMEYLTSLDGRNAVREHEKYRASSPQDWGWEATEPWKPPPIPEENVDSMFSRPWFSRIWIIQEAVVNQKTFFLCGAKIVPWEQMFTLAWSILKHRFLNLLSAKYEKSRTGAYCLTIIQTFRDGKIHCTLFDVLRLFRYAKATDERDRIYAVQNLSIDPIPDSLLLKPDYNDTVSEVYTKMAVRFYETQHHQMLSIVGRRESGRSGLPSWAVDWTGSSVPLTGFGYSAHGTSECSFKISSVDGTRRLVMQGIMLSTITDVIKIPITADWPKSLDNPENVKFLQDRFSSCVSLVHSRSNMEKMKNNQETLWRVFVEDFNLVQRARYPKNYDGDLVRFPEWILSYPVEANLETPFSYLAYLEEIRMTTGAFVLQQFAMDDMDNMCMVPVITEPGDLILIVAGYCRPLVIRTVEENQYEIIGDCYVQGYMDGEALHESPGRRFEEFVFC